MIKYWACPVITLALLILGSGQLTEYSLKKTYEDTYNAYYDTIGKYSIPDGFSLNPELSGIPQVPNDQTYVEVNGNIPYFNNQDVTATEPWISLSQQDHLGRTQAANAVLSVDLMPADNQLRKDLSEVKPSGWQQANYEFISNGGWLYNRCHLIGYQLSGLQDEPNNLITGTRWFNVEGMLPFENFVANTIEEEEQLVRYRVTPIYEGSNLLASGVLMEGFSIDDNGESLQFNIFVPNRQPGVGIDYSNGDSWTTYY
ncbi:DNA/RNA non-specific endonuclease [Hutsoniella sourekii]|uniref:DNA/RNA non-specific endonuclease n=1 Tax=Hutsoniella sourekii TaxID=87650 RepID=UPI0004B4F40F|nr:DNA/RNA non-specific endonuclease [Hutsoniella sourekii]